LKSKFLLSFIFLLLVFHLNAQDETGVIYSNTGNQIFSLDSHQLKDSTGKTIFTINGNILFKGDSQDKDDIVYLLRARDVMIKQIGEVYDASMSEILFTVKKGQVYIGNARFEDRKLLIFRQNGNRFDFLDGQSKDKLGYGSFDEISSSELLAVFLGFYTLKMFGEETRQQLDVLREISDFQIKTLIKPRYDATFYFEWVWDGRILKPRWGNRPEDEWIFDGTYLRPYWGAAIDQEWVWDRKFLKPAFQAPEEFTFIWDGYTIRPYWEYDSNAEWIIEDGLARLKFDTDFRREWIIEGEAPIPVIAIIVLGIADR
jgi:hypothetical protein